MCKNLLNKAWWLWDMQISLIMLHANRSAHLSSHAESCIAADGADAVRMVGSLHSAFYEWKCVLSATRRKHEMTLHKIHQDSYDLFEPKNDWTLSSENLLNVYKIPTPWRTSCAITAHPTLRLVKKTAILPNLPVPASRQPTTRARPLTANSFWWSIREASVKPREASVKPREASWCFREASMKLPWSLREAFLPIKMCALCSTWKTRNDVAQDSSRFVQFVKRT